MATRNFVNYICLKLHRQSSLVREQYEAREMAGGKREREKKKKRGKGNIKKNNNNIKAVSEIKMFSDYH